MSRKKHLKEKLYNQIDIRYQYWDSKKKYGVQLYRHAAILKFLSEEFFLTEEWIAKILQNKTKK